MTKVLFVCYGNICRSPTAEGVFRHLVTQARLLEHFEIDSAGTHGYHIGAPPDKRSEEAALLHGVSLADLRARQITLNDFSYFDYILAMDTFNVEQLTAVCPKVYHKKIQKFLAFAKACANEDVPDPYGCPGMEGFEEVYQLIYKAAVGFLAFIQANKH